MWQVNAASLQRLLMLKTGLAAFEMQVRRPDTVGASHFLLT
jgi:hypothetical protein